MHLVVGVLASSAGGWIVLRRERIAARARQRESSAIHAPMGYLVLGGMVLLAGVLQLVLAFV